MVEMSNLVDNLLYSLYKYVFGFKWKGQCHFMSFTCKINKKTWINVKIESEMSK